MHSKRIRKAAAAVLAVAGSSVLYALVVVVSHGQPAIPAMVAGSIR